MTQRDKFNKRPCVMKYRAFKDEIRLKKVTLPKSGAHIVFVLPMPKSWSEEEKKKHFAQPHKKTPDKDNLEKALLDAVFSDDCEIWDSRVSKIWGYTGKIIIDTNAYSAFIPFIDNNMHEVLR